MVFFSRFQSELAQKSLFSLQHLFMLSYHGLACTFLAVTVKKIGFSQPVVAVFCSIKKVYVADEHLEMENNTRHMVNLYNNNLFIIIILSF